MASSRALRVLVCSASSGSVQRAVRYDDRHAQPAGPHPEGIGDREPAVRLCDVDPQCGLTSSERRTPKSLTRPWLPASCPPHRPLERQGHQDEKRRPSKRPYPETAAFICWGNRTATPRASTKSDNIRAEARGKHPGPGGPPGNWLRTIRDDLDVIRSTKGSTDDSPWRLRVETALCVFAAKKAGNWYRRVLGAAERIATRWHVAEEKIARTPRLPDTWCEQEPQMGGGVGGALLKKNGDGKLRNKTPGRLLVAGRKYLRGL